MNELYETLERLIENYDVLEEISDHPLYKREAELLAATQESLHARLIYLESVVFSGKKAAPPKEPDYHYYINLGAHLLT